MTSGHDLDASARRGGVDAVAPERRDEARVVAPTVRLRTGIGAVVVLVLVGLGVAVLVSIVAPSGVSRQLSPGTSSSASSPATGPDPAAPDAGAGENSATPVDPQATGPPVTIVFVHILGAVERPGLYELRGGDRAVDAVAAAGGFLDDADQAGVNLARPLVDGEQLYVPLVGEAPPVSSGPTGGVGGGIPGGSGVTGGDGVPVRIDLNTADAAALDTLPGIGPATAARILEWRAANGRFTAVEDLMSVSGIGEKTFADLEDLVTV